ncbi:DUF2124 domain-containing protein [Methanoregula sp.]|jgi:hypothetical protein|uniref:DUF2124 domain-containing protein n=1 Tax=Methanoregula sp. TaxID=2052170 RepID=UPI0025D1F685|nr:DUF2124 domain-containing protein [Methanoregula sp.]
MAEQEPFRGIPGILRPYKEYIKSLNLKEGDQIVYYGCVGTCTPFVELLAVAIRSMHLNQVFVPLLDESKARAILDVPDVGMQAAGAHVAVSPKVIVIMGGLAMPMMPTTKELVRDLAGRHPEAKVAGLCFQNMFERAGWMGVVPFDFTISAMIEPITVTKK